MATPISVGRIVHYVLTRDDVTRNTLGAMQAHEWQGNPLQVGDVYPMIVVRVWPHEYGEAPGVNGQVFLDGNDQLWVTSVKEGTEPGTWHWPVQG